MFIPADNEFSVGDTVKAAKAIATCAGTFTKDHEFVIV